MSNWENLRMSQENMEDEHIEEAVLPVAQNAEVAGAIQMQDLGGVVRTAMKQENSKNNKKLEQALKKIDILSSKVDTVIMQNKQILEKQSKGRIPATQLLTQDGMKKFRLAAWKTLPLTGYDEAAKIAAQELLIDVKTNGDMLDTSDKADQDLIKALTSERNDIKSQIKRKITTELTSMGSTPEGYKMPASKAYLKTHLRTIDLSEEVLVIFQQIVYVFAKFLNQRVTHLSDDEERQKENLLSDFWEGMAIRVERNTLDASRLEERTRHYLARGFKEIKK